MENIDKNSRPDDSSEESEQNSSGTNQSSSNRINGNQPDISLELVEQYMIQKCQEDCKTKSVVFRTVCKAYGLGVGYVNVVHLLKTHLGNGDQKTIKNINVWSGLAWKYAEEHHIPQDEDVNLPRRASSVPIKPKKTVVPQLQVPQLTSEEREMALEELDNWCTTLQVRFDNAILVESVAKKGNELRLSQSETLSVLKKRTKNRVWWLKKMINKAYDEPTVEPPPEIGPM